MPFTYSRDKVEVKSLLDIVDVIGRDIDLHHIGGDGYAGTVGEAGSSGESLKVNQKQQTWYDFKNKQGGDVYDWIGNINGLDVRGADFPKVLKIAADLAGVELEEMTEQERDAAKEKADIHNIYTETAEIYHKNITPVLYDYIFQKWGITRETVDKLKIGYATAGGDLTDLDKTTLKKSGLVYVNNGIIGGEVFKGRIIFPYWKNGKVVYLIGRKTGETPEAECEKRMKYKKLLVHKKEHEYVSPVVQNSYFYGEDSLRGAEYCIITEGVADCIAMLQAGLPCISPVTVQFREKDHLKLISLTKGLKRVYICNDNETNKAGLKGALNTAEALESTEIEVRLIELPKPEGVDKIDIADYMKDHSPEDFKGLMDSSVSLWPYKLNQQVIPANATSLERLRALKTFISNELKGMEQAEWELFVNNEVMEKFRLKQKDIKTTVAEVRESRLRDKEVMNEGLSKKRKVQQQILRENVETDGKVSSQDRLSRYPAEVIANANDILDSGDPFDFILRTWNKLHAGDTNIGENLLCSATCTQILNAKLGMHQKPSGATGSGKSDVFIQMKELLPSWKLITGAFSSKALFYDDDIKEGTIIYTDDVNLTNEIIPLLRSATSSFQEETVYITLTANLEKKPLKIRKRVTFWFSSVGSMQDEQLETRFFFGDTDESGEQDNRVHENQKKRVRLPDTAIDDDILICRAIFEMIFEKEYYVLVPFVDAITWNDKEHRRNWDKFLDLLLSVVVFKHRQRKIINGYLIADIEDFERAKKIYKGTAVSNATNLNGKEIEIMKAIQAASGCKISYRDLQEKTGIKATSLRYTIEGRDRYSEGLLGKVKGLSSYVETDTETGNGGNRAKSCRNKFCEYKGDLFTITSKLYQPVCTIDKEKAVRLTSEFMANTTENTLMTHNDSQLNVSHLNDSGIRENTDNTNKITYSTERGTDDAIDNLYISQESTEQNFIFNPSLSNPVVCESLAKNEVNDNDSHHFLECEPCESLSQNSSLDSEKVYEPFVSYSEDQNIYEVVGLVKIALINYAKSKYKSTVNDINKFVESFNKEIPEYGQRLGYQRVLYEAERLKERGWK
ncbi:hypothetical protein MSKOL_1833 [Methanosarcina sp. Kolksee]|uniref:toprim domain-containing protein n=1 Tax=Methanosarcina sp. Kolksee TaxID=1434099 RepID=UPI000615C847|nr:toprim domain-containing protein [Methanosarcina sp. Kolksee]AKB47610.1 hypothetical protein MSKOL_1833 [Methanosarcina sp. Kolksee]